METYYTCDIFPNDRKFNSIDEVKHTILIEAPNTTNCIIHKVSNEDIEYCFDCDRTISKFLKKVRDCINSQDEFFISTKIGLDLSMIKRLGIQLGFKDSTYYRKEEISKKANQKIKSFLNELINKGIILGNSWEETTPISYITTKNWKLDTIHSGILLRMPYAYDTVGYKYPHMFKSPKHKTFFIILWEDLKISTMTEDVFWQDSEILKEEDIDLNNKHWWDWIDDFQKRF